MEAGGHAPTMLLHVFVGEAERAGSEVAVGAMSPEVWGRLGPDLVDLVLLHLPLKSKHRCRCVSKHWKQMLTPYGLPHLCAVSFVWPSDNVGPAPDWGRILGEAYATPKKVLATPIRVDLSFLPPKFHRWLGLPMGCATDGGFVVVSDMNEEGRSLATSFCVFNPMTRSWRELPPLRVRNLQSLDRVLVDVTHYGGVDGIDVFIVCTRRGKFVPFLAEYSTVNNQWKVCNGIADTPTDWLGVGRGAAFQLGYDEEEAESVLIFHLEEEGHCRELDKQRFARGLPAAGRRFEMKDAIPLPQELLVSDEIFLTCHGENAYLVVDVPSSEYKTATIVKMSSFQQILRRSRSHDDLANAWTRVSVIPRELLNGDRFSLDEVKVAGSYICVISQDRLYSYSLTGRTWEVISRESADFSQEFLVPDMVTVI